MHAWARPPRALDTLHAQLHPTSALCQNSRVFPLSFIMRTIHLNEDDDGGGPSYTPHGNIIANFGFHRDATEWPVSI